MSTNSTAEIKMEPGLRRTRVCVGEQQVKKLKSGSSSGGSERSETNVSEMFPFCFPQRCLSGPSTTPRAAPTHVTVHQSPLTSQQNHNVTSPVFLSNVLTTQTDEVGKLKAMEEC
uniref:Uncharacterized protein n=1 Tax=Nothobranchius kadleci TaxID=1051664 RepID=A0A1A8E357_NOTKA